MTKWTMVADLRRCVGCQTCTAACKHANATPPGVQWRRVLDLEFGRFPDVQRVFVPVGCQHCDDPPCMDVCPTTATRKRADGVVTIDYELCIGCAYCAVACPYQARYRADVATFAYGEATEPEVQRADPKRLAVATKCTFCVDRIDAGLAAGLVPGVDPEATPACVNSCITQTLAFGDADDPQSNVSRLLAENQTLRMHEELGTGPNFHYLWDRTDAEGGGD
ncbi:MAG: 4Fe-4S dicluster domain-containing protein [Burkholderiaceae bacterium]